MLNRCYRLPAILLFSNHRGITNLLLFQHGSRVFCIRQIFLVGRGFSELVWQMRVERLVSCLEEF